MKSSVKRNLAMGAAVVVALGAAGGAYAATQSGSSNPRQAYLNDLAKRLNVTPKTLQSAMSGAAIDQLNAAVAAGGLTQAQANAIKQRIAQGGGSAPFGPGGKPFGGAAGPGLQGGLTAAANYLGLSQTQLFNDLKSGKTLAQIVKSTPGKSVSGLESAITSAVKSSLDKVVSQKQITSAQETQILNTLSARIGDLINGTGFRPGSFGGGSAQGMAPPSGMVPPSGVGPGGGFFPGP